MTRRLTRTFQARPDWPGLVEKLTERGTSQRALARRLGVHESTVSRYASGRARPSGDTGLVLFLLASDPD